MTSFRVDCLRWQPESDDCLVVASGQHSDVLYFDLNHSSDQPTTRSTLPSATTRHLSTAASSIADFTFVPCHPQLLVAATGEGALQWWDMRAGRIRNPAVARPASSRLPCGLSASSTLPLVYVWRGDASVDVYDVRRLPAERRREVHAWRLADGGLSRLKAVEADSHSEARFILETEGGGVSALDVWRGTSATVAGKQRWTGDMAVLSGRRRRVAWMNGLGAEASGRMQRGSTRVVAHATGGVEVKFSRVPLHSRGHYAASAAAASGSEAVEGEAVSGIDDDLPAEADLEWSDDDIESVDDNVRIQPSIHAFFQFLDASSAAPSSPPQQPARPPQPPHARAKAATKQPCACCTHVVGCVVVGGGGVSVMEAHPTLDVLVCGLVNNGLSLIAASGVADEDEERAEAEVDSQAEDG